MADADRVGLAARHYLAAGDATAAFSLLSERVIREFADDPKAGSAIDLDEIQPDVYAGAPQLLIPLASELLLRGAFEKGSRSLALARARGRRHRKPARAAGEDGLRALHPLRPDRTARGVVGAQ